MLRSRSDGHRQDPRINVSDVSPAMFDRVLPAIVLLESGQENPLRRRRQSRTALRHDPSVYRGRANEAPPKRRGLVGRVGGCDSGSNTRRRTYGFTSSGVP